MRLLHSSDWHLGHVLYQHERLDEFEYMLESIRKILEREQPDAFVVSGDIFHTPTPSRQAQRLFVDKLKAMRQSAPDTTIVVSSGNHDSGLGLEVARPLWSELDVHIIGQIERQDSLASDLDKHIIEVRPRGELCGYIVALPYSTPRNFPQIEGSAADSGEERQAAYVQALLKRCNELNTSGLPIVLMAHLTALPDYRDPHDMIGGLEHTDINSFGTHYDYLALGHIHKPWTLRTNAPNTARYSGSPIAMDFDETHQPSVSLVNIEGRHSHIETQPLSTLRPLITFPDQAIPFDKALQKLQESLRTTPEQEGYLRLQVLETHADLPSDARQRCSEILANSGLRFCLICGGQPREHIGVERGLDISVEELQSLPPLDLALRYYQEQRCQAMPDNLQTKLRQAIAQAQTSDE